MKQFKVAFTLAVDGLIEGVSAQSKEEAEQIIRSMTTEQITHYLVPKLGYLEPQILEAFAMSIADEIFEPETRFEKIPALESIERSVDIPNPVSESGEEPEV
jgi:hypothetical protein|tara:strand:- start:370 stop:675 length:306 start_codon:yes stop_codon:yes gene_type:complete